MPWTGNRTAFLRLLNPSPTYQYKPIINSILSQLKDTDVKIDLGAGGRKITADTIAIDIARIGGTDIIADLQFIPLRAEVADVVFCTGTLEHLTHPEIVVGETARILKRQGLAYIDVPFMQGYHPDPVDYWRFTIPGLELMCERNGLTKIESGVAIGASSAATWINMELIQTALSQNLITKILAKAICLPMSSFKYMDRFLHSLNRNTAIPSAVYYIGTKA